MKLNLIIATLALLAVASCCLGAEEPNKDQSLVAKNKLFDFARFKSLFNKSYNSLAEEIARERIFLGNAFRAFLSLVRYKASKVGMYMKIHDKSDWTNEELRSMEGRRTDEVAPAPPVESKQEVADLATIESQLREVLANKDANPALEKIAKELEGSGAARRKRSTGNKRDSVSIDDLFRVPTIEKASIGERVPSNNVHYSPPELESFGAEDNEQQPAMMGWTKVGLPSLSDIRDSLSNTANLISNGLNYEFSKKHDIVVRPDLPDEVFVDHRTSGCLGSIKSQGQCGSCFIFSTNALYEWHYCKESGFKAVFSEQYPMDCGQRIGITGCDGGFEQEVSRFYGIYGIELRMNYPYRMHVDTCPYNKRMPEDKMGYLKVNGDQLKYITKKQMEEYIVKAPIVIGLGVSDEFHHYGSGVDMGEHCDKRRGHSMLIIGSGREDGVEYWLIRNSYGSWWGDDGHYKIAKDADHCFLNFYTGGVLDPKRGSVFQGKQNPEYDGAPVLDHYEHYVPTPQKQKTGIFTFFATPAPN